MASTPADVARLCHEIESKLKQLLRKCFENKGFTMPQGMVIGSLFKHSEMKISQLSKALGLSNSTVSGIVDRLEKQDIVERIRSQEDKRIVYVKLTPEFADMHRNLVKGLEKQLEEILNTGSEEEFTKVVDGLLALRDILDRAAANAGTKSQ